jgi:glycerol-3-phosphate dehydrogenase
MIRDIAELTRRRADVLVVGGGIYGLTIACDAAQRGLSVVLIERSDFGSGSSFNHLRTIHGGLRYLQSLDIRRARESILERRTLARIAPQAVKPLPFILPLYPSLTKGPLAARAGALLDRFVSRDRNTGVAADLRLPAARVVPRAQAATRFPDLFDDRIARGASHALLWHDYVTPESDRLTFAWAQAASNAGAVLANYVEATRLVVEGGRAVGLRAVDRLLDRDLELLASVIVNATGGSLNGLLRSGGIASAQPFVKAMNLVTRRPGQSAGFGGRMLSGRNLFAVPWRGAALFGTWEAPRPSESADTAVSEQEIIRFVADLNASFPALELAREDVLLVHRGLVPAARRPDGTVTLEAHERIRDHSLEGVHGLISVAGTKYTTARGVAERVTDRLLAMLKREAAVCRTASSPLPYASERAGILELAATCPEWGTPISDSSSVIGADLVWAVRHEMALTLNDAVVRRTPLGALGYPGDKAAASAAAIVGAELGWTEEQKREETAALREFYKIW